MLYADGLVAEIVTLPVGNVVFHVPLSVDMFTVDRSISTSSI
jgi:hypothetical protein